MRLKIRDDRFLTSFAETPPKYFFFKENKKKTNFEYQRFLQQVFILYKKNFTADCKIFSIASRKQLCLFYDFKIYLSSETGILIISKGCKNCIFKINDGSYVQKVMQRHKLKSFAHLRRAGVGIQLFSYELRLLKT